MCIQADSHVLSCNIGNSVPYITRTLWEDAHYAKEEDEITIRKRDRKMRYLVNAAQMKKADTYTIQEVGIPSMELMERAAGACVQVMEEEELDLSAPCVVCGSGNNGGDGFAIARILLLKGCPVTVCFVGDETRCTDETRQQMKKLLEIGGRISNGYIEGEYSIMIDAIFGVGLGRRIRGDYLDVIERMNAADAVKFAVDMPSGISADTGMVLGIAFRADITVTFQLEKTGLVLYPGKKYAGNVRTVEIGIHTEQLKRDHSAAYVLDQKELSSLLPAREPDSNKGTYGKLLMITGSIGMSGAAYLSAKAAYLSGAGLVRIYTPEENRIILQQQLPEAVITTYTGYDGEEVEKLLAWADTVCIGSGFGTGKLSEWILKKVLAEVKVPCLVDADGLNILAAQEEYPSLLHRDRTDAGTLVLTPHMKEMSRLLKESVDRIKEQRMELAEAYARRISCTCVLKDSRTVTVSPDEGSYVNLSGNAAMAKAGSGDVLAGVISGLMVQGLDGHSAGVLGTYLHGRAGDHARKLHGSYSVLAGDLLSCLGKAFKELEEEQREEL